MRADAQTPPQDVGPTEEQMKPIQGLCSCFSFFFIICVVVAIQRLLQLLYFQSQAECIRDWEDAQVWRNTSCKVVTAGVSCVEDDTGSTCGYARKTHISKASVVNGASVFDWGFLSVCPGTYVCSDEGETCNCTGVVTYAAELFNGKEFFEHRDFSQTATGSVKCGTDENGKPYKDPAPYVVKYCFCTPSQIIEKLHGHDVITKNFTKCAQEANSDFFGQSPSPAAASHQPEVGRRLDEESTGRQLTSSPRRRRTYSYTPWALVKVQEDGFENSKSVLTCAYEYGAPAASYEYYQGDDCGTGSFDMTSMLKDWALKDICAVRMAGQSGADTCAVGLGKLGGLSEKRSGDMWWSRFWVITFFIASIPVGGCTFFFGRIVVGKFIMDVRRERYQQVPTVQQ